MSDATPPPMVFVVWEDASVLDSGTWSTEKDHKYEPKVMHTVGFLLNDDEQGVIVTNCWNEDCVAPRDQIPRGMIRSMGFLQAVPPKRGRRK